MEEAITVLTKGLDIEPDHPLLLAELGLIGCQAGRASGDRASIERAFDWYAHAFDSRPYNTPAQKALALRGMGFVSIELNDWERAEKFYENSLTWQESTNARKQLEIIQGIKQNPAATVSISGSNFDSGERVDSYEHFLGKKQKLPQFLQKSLPDKYVYIWTKAAKLCLVGADNFCEEDFFNYPLKNWNLEEIASGSYQISQFLKGFHPDYALDNLSETGLAQLLETFHFEVESEKILRSSSNNPVQKFCFRHVMDQSTIELYSLTRERVVESWWKIWK